MTRKSKRLELARRSREVAVEREHPGISVQVIIDPIPESAWPTSKEIQEWERENKRTTVLHPGMSGRLDRKRRASFRQRREVLRRDGYRCRYCGAPVTYENAHIDHVTPWIRTGITRVPNLVTACRPCNVAKGMQMDVKPSPPGGPYADPFKQQRSENAGILAEVHRLDREYAAILHR